jgi:ABC-type uncharacterized transport system permease subunit
MDKQAVLFEATLDFVVSFFLAALAYWATRTFPTVQFVLIVAGLSSGFFILLDMARRKEKVQVLVCGLTTFLGMISGGAMAILLK